MNSKPIPLILDSGATSFYQKYISGKTVGAPGTHFKDKRNIDFSPYGTKQFKRFRDAYIRFVKKNDKYLFGYVNMDMINNAEGSYESLKYMESKGCHPLPVYHLGNDVRWLKRYIREGYKFVCIGGITPNPTTTLRPILDRIWRNILTDNDGMPLVKVHGLACTSYTLMRRYPWYSVDSATWTKLGAWGGIYVPRKEKGKFSFDRPPFGIHVSEESPSIKKRSRHLFTMAKVEKRHIKEWLDLIGVPLGRSEKELGVTNDYQYRMKANLLFFQALVNSIPRWPWPLSSRIKNPDRKPFFK